MIVSATPYRAPVLKPPVVVDAVPRFGMGRLESYDTESPMFLIALASEHSDFQTNPKFYLPDAAGEDYYYYMSPVEFGKATFVFSGFTGGWDGATWPLDDMGDTYGPVEITFGGRQWLFYRTDWPGGMGGTYTVGFENL